MYRIGLGLFAPLVLSVVSPVPVDPPLAVVLGTTVTLTPAAVAAKVGDRDTLIGKVAVGGKNCSGCTLFFNVVEPDKAIIVGTFRPSGSTKQNGVIVRSIAAGTAHIRAGYKGHSDTSVVVITDTTTPPPSCVGTATTICPGDDWQAKVNAQGAATFTIGAGTHRLQSVVPKSGQQFIGQPGAVMSGAKLLTGWASLSSVWYVGGQTQEFSHTIGVCESGWPCQYPEDVYRDDALLHRETSLAAVGPGDFYFDYAADRIYVGDDPTGHTLEAAAVQWAFSGSASDVVIRGLVVEKYATPAQDGAIGKTDAGPRWIVRGNEVRFNHGGAIRGGTGMVIAGNHLHHNAQIGVIGGGFARVDSNEIDHNNTAHFRSDWEAGGTKMLWTVNMIVRGNNSHDNHGVGLWTDTDNTGTIFDGNTVERNDWMGIHHEVSYGGRITNNIVRDNGLANPNGAEGGGIMVTCSGGTGLEISGNTLSGNKNAIMLLQADRGSGNAGLYATKNVSVHDNTVTLSGSQRTGAHRYDGDTGLWTVNNNHFEHNTYHLQTAAATPFEWSSGLITDAAWQALSNDETGTFNR